MVEEIKYGQPQPKMIAGKRPAGAAPRRASGADKLFVASIAEKRYLWTARAFAIITALSLCCNIVLILAIFQVMPLYRVAPFLLTFQSQAERVYNITPITGELRNYKAVTEVFVRDYVLQRSTFTSDIDIAKSRWMPGGTIQEMSSPQIYQDFWDNVGKKALTFIQEKGMERKVRILSINELSNNIWQVEYETSDTYPSSLSPEINYWTASMTINYRRKTVKYGERLKNPLGFTVVKYALTRNNVE